MARHRWATSAPSTGGFSFPRDREDRQEDAVPSANDLEPFVDEMPHSRVGDQVTAGRGRQWAVGRGAALVALGLALSLAVGLFVLRGGTSPEVASIALDGPTSGQQGSGAAPRLSGSATSSETPSSAPPAEELMGSVASTAGPSGTAGPDSQRLIVHVAGAVNRPGIVELDAGSRVFEALEQAGGALPEADLAAINLASPVQDGLQIRVPLRGETLPPVSAGAFLPGTSSPDPSATGPPGAPGTPGLINLNTADTAALETLPRIGPVLAERIIQWRTEHGGFSSPEDLDAVPGIGEAMLAALVPLVTV